jgi:hypothetical protein
MLGVGQTSNWDGTRMIGDDEKEERGGRTFRKLKFNQYIVYSKEYGVVNVGQGA